MLASPPYRGCPPSNSTFSPANNGDDEALRCFELDNPIPGRVTLSYAREPSYFHGDAITGDQYWTLVSRAEETGKIACKFSHSFRHAYVNSKKSRLGYLGQLRVRPDFPGKGKLIRQGFKLCHTALKESGALPYYLTSIIEPNQRARRVLTARLPGMPIYRDLGSFHTLVIPCRRARRVKPGGGISIKRASRADLPQIADCLQRNYKRYQFAPVWTIENLGSSELCRDLHARDFVVAVKGGKVIGCVAIWDQSRFKQYIVRGYSRGLSASQPLLSGLAKLCGFPGLPRKGDRIRGAYLSHVAADADDRSVLRALMNAALKEAKARGHALLMTGFAESHPLLEAVRKHSVHIEYPSRLYLVHWDEGAAAIDALDQRPIHVEIAIM